MSVLKPGKEHLLEAKEQLLKLLQGSPNQSEFEFPRRDGKAKIHSRAELESKIKSIDVELKELEKFDTVEVAFIKVVNALFKKNHLPLPDSDVIGLFNKLAVEQHTFSSMLPKFNESIVNEKRKPLYKAKQLAQATLKKLRTGKSNGACIAEVKLNGQVNIDDQGLIRVIAAAIDNYLPVMTPPQERVTPKEILFHLLPTIRELKSKRVKTKIVVEFLSDRGLDTSSEAINVALRRNPPRQAPPKD